MCLRAYNRQTETDRDFNFSLLDEILKTLLIQYRFKRQILDKELGKFNDHK